MSNGLTEQDYGIFRRFLEDQCGIVLGENKQYLVKSRLTPLLGRFRLADLSALIKMVVNGGGDRDLRPAVIDAMTTNETLWFRDGYPFDLLTEKLFPELGKGGRNVKIWSAACSSGQEPYSIAIKALEHQTKKPGTLPGGVQILATDISHSMLSQCQGGEYDSLALGRGMSDERRRLYFDETAQGTWRIKPNVRRLVTFRHFNLLSSYTLLGKFDIVFCRNVLIYFSPENKLRILNDIAKSLNPGGYLFLGASESMPTAVSDFEMVRCNPGIIYRRK